MIHDAGGRARRVDGALPSTRGSGSPSACCGRGPPSPDTRLRRRSRRAQLRRGRGRGDGRDRRASWSVAVQARSRPATAGSRLNIGTRRTAIHGTRRGRVSSASAQRPVDLALSDDALWIANATDFATQPPTGGGTVSASRPRRRRCRRHAGGAAWHSRRDEHVGRQRRPRGVGGERNNHMVAKLENALDGPDPDARRGSRERGYRRGLRRVWSRSRDLVVRLNIPAYGSR